MGGKSHHRKQTSIRKEFGSKAQLCRYEIGYTEEELAEKAVLHLPYIEIERGERNIALENIYRFS